MNYIDLIDNMKNGKKLYSFPFKKNSGIDFYERVRNIFLEYLKDVRTLDANSIYFLNNCFGSMPLKKKLDVINDVEFIARKTLNILNYLLCGFPASAYIELEHFLNRHSFHYSKLLPQLIVKEHDNRQFFRIRRGLFDKHADLFHIPFELKHIIQTERFSIPGYPVLYLAGSMNGALHAVVKNKKWLNFSYVKMKSKKDLCFIDLGFPSITPLPFELFSHIIFYPLFIASSVEVEHKKGCYKIEYGLPQLLTQYVKNFLIFDGISYLPPQIEKPYGIDDFEAKDFAVIVRNASLPKGFDYNLISSMKMSPVVQYGFTDKIKRCLLRKDMSDYTIEKIENKDFMDIDIEKIVINSSSVNSKNNTI